MSRKTRNIILTVIVALMLAATAATMCFAGRLSAGQSGQNQQQMQTPQGNQSQSEINADAGGNENSPPEKPEGSGADESDGTAEDGSDGTADKENAAENMQDNAGSPPSMPAGESGNMNAPGDGAMTPEGSQLSLMWYLLFAGHSMIIALAVMYMVMSKANKRKLKETFCSKDKVIIYILSAVIITGALTFAEGAAVKNYIPLLSSAQGEEESSADAEGATEVTTDEELDGSFESTKSDQNTLLVKDGGKLTLTEGTVKKSGDSTNTENSEFYGINSGVLATEGSEATIKGSSISTDAVGSNAVFATGENARIYISDSSITTKGASSARGLDATYGGYIEASNVDIITQGNSCAALATDRGEGVVKADDSTLETNGTGSPVIYSTGEISIENTSGTANGSQMVVIEGKNSAAVTNSTLAASAAGNRNNVDNAGVMIYQSMSGDAAEGQGSFTATDSALSIMSDSQLYETAPMFFVTNTDASISLENTTLEFGSGILLSAKGTDEWGDSGSNGGTVTLNAVNQALKGDVVLDEISTLDMQLESSEYTGTINGENSAKEVSLTLDKKSKITLTGDSYVTSLKDADESYDNINFNGYTLYVNGKAIN